MSDEWLEHRSLRGRRPGQRDEATPRALPRLRDAEGDLKPLEPDHIEALAEIVQEAERGIKPAGAAPDWVPRFETNSGEFMRLTSEHIEELRQQMAAEQAKAEEAALARSKTGEEKPPEDESPGFRPRLRTSTGEIQRLSQADLDRLRNDLKVAESIKGSSLPQPDLPEIETAPQQFEPLTPERIEAAWKLVLEEEQASAPRRSAAMEASASYRSPEGIVTPLAGPGLDQARRQLEAHERGEGPRDWVPMFTTSTGDFERMTMDALERLAEKERAKRAAVRVHINLDGPLLVEQPGAPLLRDPQYDTPTGRFARVPREEESIDAGWVRELHEESTMSTPGPVPATQPPKPRPTRPPATQTQYYLERIRTGVRPWQMLLVALILLGVGSLLFVPRRLYSLGLGGPLPSPSATLAMSTPMPTATVAAAATPAADPLGTYALGRVAYASNRSGNYEIYVLNLEARTAQQITNHPADDRQPGWSPDGMRLAFVSDRDGDADIWVMNADGSGLVQITTEASSVDNNPRWSPDGTLIAFSRETAGGSLLLAIPTNCLSDPGTCESQAVTLVNSFARQISFSPDGAQMAYTGGTFAGLPTAIHINGRNGGAPRVLEGSGATDSYPVWSPDGGLLAFVSNARGGPDLWLMRPDGSELRPLTLEAASDVEPAWGPRAAVLLFATDRAGDFDLALISTSCLDPEEGCEDALIYLTSGQGSDINPAWWLPPGT